MFIALEKYCGRCGATEDLIIHTRNRKKVSYYCRRCQRDRQPKTTYRPRKTLSQIEDELAWSQMARQKNESIMAKYAKN